MAVPPAPHTEFVYEAIVDIADTEALGIGPFGERFIVPILGGTFEGARLRGVVLPGGADRQVRRADGVLELDAIYEMRTHDGIVLAIRNRVIIDAPDPANRYAMSHVKITAPIGTYDWLNRRLFVGTLQPLLPQRKAVRVRVYQVV
jgi:hypothetical protein